MNSLAKSQVRDQRRAALKLDCVDLIEYVRWEPGHEYKKTFVVKNIATKVQTLRWEHSISPFFEVQFQEPHARLGPMMIAAINIVFRPAALENYSSSVEFRTLRGKFVLELRGLLPAINLGIPPAMDFCYGPVNDITEKTFMMRNTSDITVTYEWVVKPPFYIFPTRASIQKGKSEMVYCRFQPEKAAAFSATALCCTYIGVASEMKLKGIGKYSFLAVSTPLLAFGEIVVRTTKEMTLVVTNISIVPAKFQVVKLENKLCKTDPNFNVIPMNGVIKANTQITFKVVFTPITAGSFSVDKFEIHTCQTCRASFACTGTAARPVVKLSTFSLDFGSVEAGGHIVRSVLVDNQSIVPLHFQFMTDDMSVFEFLQTRGMCRPNRATMINIHFRPTVIANYYKRIILVLQDQHALYCDLLGTCYRVALKSPTLMQYHVDQHRELLKTSCAEMQLATDQGKTHFPSKKSVLANLRPYFTASTTSPSALKKGLSGAEWESHPGAWHAMLEHPDWAKEKASAPDHGTSPKPAPGEVSKSVTFEPGSDSRHADKFAPSAAQLAHVYLNPAAGEAPQGPRHRTSGQQRELAQQLLETEGGEDGGDDNGEFGPDNVGADGVPWRRKSRLDSRYLVFSKTWQRGMEGYKHMFHHEIWDEFFIGRMEYWEPVTIDSQLLNFGLGKYMQLSDPHFLHVHNNVQTPVTLLWLSPQQPKIAEFTGIKPKCPCPKHLHRHDHAHLQVKPPNTFHVVPDKAIIPVGGSYTFSVIFEPQSPNNHYCQFLQLFVWTPSIDRVIPPWSTLVCAAGHSFQTQSQEFLPEYSVSKTKVNFPPVLKGFSVHQIIILRNHNITVPLSFIFEIKTLHTEFVVKPEQGLIPPGEFQLITFRYDAGEPQQISDNLRCVLNHSAIDDLVFILNGSSHVPKLMLEKNGVVRFKPTSVGTRTTIYIILCNASAIATEFEWQVPKKISEVFVIKPIGGLLRPGESVNVSICFLPQGPKLYYCNIPCRAFAHVEKAYVQDNGMAIENVPTREVNRIHLIANGEGVVDTVHIEPGVLQYGFLVVGFPHKNHITLKNLSAGSLRFALVAYPKNHSQEECTVSFDRPMGQLHGHARLKVTVTLHATVQKYFEFVIVCRTYLPLQEMPQYFDLLQDSDPLKYMSYDMNMSAPSGKTATGLLTVNAKYPYLVIAAVRSEGLSNLQMWKELQVRKLNYALCDGRLDTKPSGEAIYQDLFCCGHKVDHSRVFTVDFGAQVISTNQSIIDLVIKSGNELPVQWRVRLWNDVEVDMENWVVPVDPTEEERRWMMIRKFNLFHVEPRKGYVLPGEEQYVRFRYVHIMDGKHILPAILEVQHGRTLHLNLQGRSVADPPRILVTDTETQWLHSTPVGELNPAYHTVELWNRGPVDIDYEVDTSPLEEMKLANYGFRVLWCQNPSGVVPSMESILLNWMFQPLEPKDYSVTVPIHVSDGEGRLLKLAARGIHPENEQGFIAEFTPPNAPPNMGQTYNWPDLPVILSTELLDFEGVVELSENYRLVAIQCLVEDCKVSFAWHNSAAVEKNLQGKFEILPAEGILAPGKQVLCKVHFTAGFQPHIFETSICLALKRIPIEPEELISIPQARPPLPPQEVLVDTWPPRLGVGIFNKLLKHDCVIERFTSTAKLHMTDNARFKLERLEENRDLERNKQLEKEALTFNPPAPIFTNIYLTIRSQVFPRVFNSTTEDLLSTEERLSFKIPEKTVLEVQMELVFGIILELVQESLHEEMQIESFESLEKIGERILFFEDFKKPPPKSDIPPEEYQLEGFPEGTLSEPPPGVGDPTEPGTPLLTLTKFGKGLVANDGKTQPEALDDVLRNALSKPPPPTPPQLEDDRHAEVEPDEPSEKAMDCVYVLLEEVLFHLVKEVFEEES